MHFKVFFEVFIYSSTHRDQYPRFAFQSVPKRTFDGSPLYVPSRNFEGFDIKGVGLVTKFCLTTVIKFQVAVLHSCLFTNFKTQSAEQRVTSFESEMTQIKQNYPLCARVKNLKLLIPLNACLPRHPMPHLMKRVTQRKRIYNALHHVCVGS